MKHCVKRAAAVGVALAMALRGPAYFDWFSLNDPVAPALHCLKHPLVSGA